MADFRRGSNNNNCISYYNANVDENYEISWRMISERILHLLKRGPKTPMTFEPLYSQIYRTACAGKAERMYLDLMSLCSRHLSEIEQLLCPPDEATIDHLITVGDAARDYLECIKKISLIFSYLNKSYVTYQLCSDLFTELAGLFNQTILNQRIPALMRIAEETLQVPCSFSPTILHRFFNDIHVISEGEYSVKYPHLFSRYCVNVLPEMRECDLETHIAEVRAFQERQRTLQVPQANQGLKRRLEEDDNN